MSTIKLVLNSKLFIRMCNRLIVFMLIFVEAFKWNKRMDEMAANF